jgi:hypothetical protein
VTITFIKFLSFFSQDLRIEGPKRKTNEVWNLEKKSRIQWFKVYRRKYQGLKNRFTSILNKKQMKRADNFCQYQF